MSVLSWTQSSTGMSPIHTELLLVFKMSSESGLFLPQPLDTHADVVPIRSSLVERAQTTLRDVVGSRTLQSVISDRTEVARQVEEIVENVAEKWGVTIESILIKDIIFSRDLQESLSSAATQRRIGESKVIAARAEVDAARLMRQAADILAR